MSGQVLRTSLCTQVLRTNLCTLVLRTSLCTLVLRTSLCTLVLRTSLCTLVRRTSTPFCQPQPCWCEGPLCLRPILDDSHFTTACDTSNMTSDYSRSYTLTKCELGQSSPLRSLFAAKPVGRWGDGPRFAGGPQRAARIRAVGRIFQIRLWELAARAQTCGSSQREHKPVGARGASTKIFESSKFLYPKYQLASEKYLIFHSIFTATPPQKIEKIGERGSNLVLK